MLKTLQGNERADGGAINVDGPNELVLDSAYTDVAIKVIKAARSEIRLCAYAWRWYEMEPEIGIQKLNVELLRACKRGVSVRCLVDTEAMKRIFLQLGFTARAVHPTRMLHTKAICADTNALLIGSHNLTKRANTDNYEASILSREFELNAQFITYFDKMWDSRG